MKRRRVKRLKTAWMTGEIITMISKRDKLRKVFLSTRTATSEPEFRKYRTFVQNKIMKTKKEYFRNKWEKAKNSTDVWKVYREI